MKIFTLLLHLIWVLGLLTLSCSRNGNDRLFLGRAKAEARLTKALLDTTDVLYSGEVLIESQKVAIEIAEAYLFSAYGEEKITSERPYEIFLINSFWVIKGTLPFGSDGGTFQIVIDSRDGSIEQLLHTR